jgi:hypothetical protein
MVFARSRRSALELDQAQQARREKIALVLGRAMHKLIRSHRAIVTTRIRLATCAAMARRTA